VLPIALSVGAVIVLAAVTAVALLLAGGKPAARPGSASARGNDLTNVLLAQRQLYVSTQQPTYAALLPAGWQPTAVKTAGVSSAFAVQSPIDSTATITVGQVSNPGGRLSADGHRFARQAAADSSFRQAAAGATTLPGGRQAWQLAYTASGMSNAVYLVRSCGKEFAITATVPPSRVSLVRDRVSLVAGTLQGTC
jgi:hypothetical protein